MVKGHPNERLVHDLVVDGDNEGSPFLRALDTRFRAYFTFDDSPILSFYETHRSPTVVGSPFSPIQRKKADINIKSYNLESGHATLDGPHVMMVPSYSATHSGVNERLCNQLPVESNHRDLVKFRDQWDVTFLVVRNRLKQMVLEAPGAVETRYRAKSAPREGIFDIPFPRNPSFTDRGDVLHLLEEMLPLHEDGMQKRAALTGLGGTG